MICFEEFDPLTNYPVVLPCGHTYVCIACANRLDKCMECRETLIAKIEVPSPSSHADPTAKENVAGRYPHGGTGGHRPNYSQQSRQHHVRGKYGQQQQQRPPPKTYVTQRLPLPKNAVLLSLIQASEPARRRHREEQDANNSNNSGNSNLPPALPSSHSDDDDSVAKASQFTVSSTTSTTAQPPSSSSRVKFHKPSPLFVDGNASPVSTVEHMGSMLEHNDEEHKIRVGTYLEGGPCGTYAVAVRAGLVVYPTLFEHSLQTDGMDGMSRDVENMVKNSYRNKLLSRHKDKKSFRGGGMGGNDGGNAKGGLPRSASCANATAANCMEGGMTNHEGGESNTSAAVAINDNNTDEEKDEKNTAEITLNYDAGNNLNTSGENLAVEAQFTTSKSEVSDHRDHVTTDPSTTNISSSLHRGEAMSDPGGSSGSPAVSNSLLKSTLQGGAKGQTKKKQLLHLPTNPSSSALESTPTESKFDIGATTNADPALSATLKLRRQFSLGSGNPADDGEVECERSLIRLNYGDRVQVVSMDSRGWVKLARGYGYIRLEHEKQLVKGAFVVAVLLHFVLSFLC